MVDTTILGYVPVDKAGDTMTGDLVLNADPTLALGAATKQYVDATPGTGANTALSNLAAVAINASLEVDTDATYDLGAQNFRWANTYSQTLRTGQTATDTVLLQAYDTGAAGYVTWATLTAGNPSTFALADGATAVTQAASDNSTKIATTAYADAAAGAGSGMVLLGTETAAGAASLDLDNYFDGTYDSYKIFVTGIRPSTDGSLLYARVGTGATPTYQSGAGAYAWTQRAWPLSDDISNSATQIQLFGDDGVGNDTGESASYEITVQRPADTSLNTNIAWEGVVNDNGSTAVSSYSIGAGTYLATTAVTSLQLLFSAGNITAEAKIYGIRG